jgi:DNA-binding response OmpR family regulator
LDLLLPFMDGWTFRREADRQRTLEGIPVILISGVADVQREAETMQAAAAFGKPFDPDVLVQTICTLLDDAPETDHRA